MQFLSIEPVLCYCWVVAIAAAAAAIHSLRYFTVTKGKGVRADKMLNRSNRKERSIE
jgi:hypothetical protein